MSDPNLTDKMSETITNVIKKTSLFEKIKNIEFYFGSFVIISSIVGITSLVMHYSNINQIKKNQEEIDILKKSIITNAKDILIGIEHLDEKLSKLDKVIVISLENQLNCLNEIKNLPLLNIGKIDKLSRSTSISSIFLESTLPPLQKSPPIILDDDWHISEQEEKNKYDENELNNDCYDSIPLSNIKKITGKKSWLF